MKSILLSLAFVTFWSIGFGQTISVDSDKVAVEFSTVIQKTKGSIGGFHADITFDPEKLSMASISGTVDLQTLSTGNKMRDRHLKGDDYFDAEKYPTMRFESSNISKNSEGYSMTGQLTIKETTHEETIDFSFKNGEFSGKMTIHLSDYKVGNFSKKSPEKNSVTISFTIPTK